MKALTIKRSSAAALTLAGAALSVTSGAQVSLSPEAKVFSAVGVENYGLVNGQTLSLYINERGDLGSPVILGAGGARIKNGSAPGTANINDNGSVNGTQAYGALLSATNTLPAGSIGASVRSKTEFLTGGTAREGFSLNTGLGFLTPNQFSVSSPIAPLTDGRVGLASTLATGNISLRQEVSLANLNGRERARFDIILTNNGATRINTQYARVFDPNPAGQASTRQVFGIGSQSGVFGIRGENGDNSFGIGVLPGDPNTVGTSVYTTVVGDVGLNSYLASPQTQTGGPGSDIREFVRLNSGLGATYTSTVEILPGLFDYVDTTTNNFTQGFVDTTTGDPLTPFNGPVTASYLTLLSPLISLDAANTPGATQRFTFYMFLDTANINPVPEPGVTALAVGAVGGLLIARRRRKK